MRACVEARRPQSERTTRVESVSNYYVELFATTVTTTTTTTTTTTITITTTNECQQKTEHKQFGRNLIK